MPGVIPKEQFRQGPGAGMTRSPGKWKREDDDPEGPNAPKLARLSEMWPRNFKPANLFEMAAVAIVKNVTHITLTSIEVGRILELRGLPASLQSLLMIFLFKVTNLRPQYWDHVVYEFKRGRSCWDNESRFCHDCFWAAWWGSNLPALRPKLPPSANAGMPRLDLLDRRNLEMVLNRPRVPRVEMNAQLIHDRLQND